MPQGNRADDFEGPALPALRFFVTTMRRMRGRRSKVPRYISRRCQPGHLSRAF
jgi:hypothetical protein